jgi:hypothetical protein
MRDVVFIALWVFFARVSWWPRGQPSGDASSSCDNNTLTRQIRQVVQALMKQRLALLKWWWLMGRRSKCEEKTPRMRNKTSLFGTG